MPDPKKKNSSKPKLTSEDKRQFIEILKKYQSEPVQDKGVFTFGEEDPIFDNEEDYYDYYGEILAKNNAIDPKYRFLMDKGRMSKKDALLMSPRIKFPNFQAYQKQLQEREEAPFDGRYLQKMNKNARVKYGNPTSRLGYKE